MNKLEITLKYDELIAALTRLALALESKQAPVQVLAGEPVEMVDPAEEVPPVVPKEIKDLTKEEKPVTVEQIRLVLTAKSQAGKKAAIQELFKKYGADKLTSVDPARYTELLKEAGEL